MARGPFTALSIALAGDDPPSEFRIFAAGANETTKGTFTFDEAAAVSVMAEYARHGIDIPLDYDHAMLGTDRAMDPALAGRAAGWFALEVRNGELWATNVRWTEPAAEALRAKEWRFMSPAFQTDDSGRVTSLLNVAITNLPATRRLEPLMAANVMTLGGAMLDAETVKKAIAAVAAKDADAMESLLTEMIAGAASGEAPAEEAPAEALAEEPAPPEDEEEEQAAVMAATSRLVRLTGKGTIGAAVEEVEIWRASHIAIEADRVKLAKEREALELGKRKENAITLTKLGAETPHTTGLAKGKLCARLLSEPLDEQNARVAALLAARGGKLPPEIKPPPGDATVADGGAVVETPIGPVTLSAREVAMCAEMKIDPKTYAANKPKKKG